MTQEEPKIRIYYETWDEDSIDTGETNDRGWEDEAGVSMQPDQYDIEEGLTPVDLAVKFLTDNGPLQASSSSFAPRVWYTVQAKVSKTMHAKPHGRIDVFD